MLRALPTMLVEGAGGRMSGWPPNSLLGGRQPGQGGRNRFMTIGSDS